MSTRSSRLLKLNESGMGLMEVLVIVGIMGIMAFGIVSMMTEMQKQRQIANLKAQLTSQKFKLEGLIRDPISWSTSINDPANAGKVEYTCMRVPPVPAAGCADNTGTPPPPGGVLNSFAVLESNGLLYYNSSGATNGFNSEGQTCSTYPSAACPIRWDLRVINKCPAGASPCPMPTVRVIGRPIIDPSVQEMLHLSINPDNYAFDITRGVGTRFDPILVTEVLAQTGAGSCAGSPARQFNTRAQDDANNVSLPGSGWVQFEPGSYQCRITAPAFKVGTHYIRMVSNTGATIGTSAASIAPRRYSKQTNAVLEVAFSISSATRFQILHNCQFSVYPSPPLPGETTDVNLQLGISTATPGNYFSTSVVYATLACYRNG